MEESFKTTNADEKMEEVETGLVQAEQRRLIETKRRPPPAVKVKVKAMQEPQGFGRRGQARGEAEATLSSIPLPSFVERAVKKKKISPKRAATEVASSSKRYKVAEPAEAPTLSSEMLRAIPRRTMEQHLADHARAVQEATEKAMELAGNHKGEMVISRASWVVSKLDLPPPPLPPLLGRFRRDRLQRNPLANRIVELLPDNA
ncbi:unnamed protein product [Symbiodinium natans]|uniref:Uncharacterized protein n=1 Tax=Symbiodinium natans TaxID=878477 RepID=A0A812NAJ9_9DINO|nr:unnamed protein product [Symbiodinium natans]